MKNYTQHRKTLVFSLITIFSIYCNQTSFAATCKGSPVASCNTVTNVSACSNMYMSSATSAAQCVWNVNYCSDSGMVCTK